MNSIELGKFLASLRNEKKLTQEELAEKLYIDKRKVSRWECGTSIPDFDTLIKLSEILNVSLYELSICKRLDKEKLSTKTKNKLKSIKDYKKLKLKKKLLILLLIILGICFIITTAYTLRNSGTVEIYEFESLDNKYYINGYYIKTKEYGIFNIFQVSLTTTANNIIKMNLNNCEYEIYNNNNRLMHINNQNNIYINNIRNFNQKQDGISSVTILTLKSLCNENKETENITFKFKLNKKYDNNLF